MIFKKLYSYMTTKADNSFEAKSDPSIQLKQAITDLKQKHRRLQQQAGLIVGQQRNIEIQIANNQREQQKISSTIEHLLRTSMNSDTRPAEKLKAEQQAERAANRLCLMENELEDLKQIHIESENATQHAKQKVEESKYRIEGKLFEYKRLMLQINQVKMQEIINSTRVSFDQNPAIPDMDDVREKIETRYANALGAAEIAELDGPADTEYDMGAGYRKLEQIRHKLQIQIKQQ